MLLNYKSIDFKNKELIKVFFIYTHTQKKLRKGGIGKVFTKLRGYQYVNFGNHCIFLSFLSWYLYQKFIIFLFYDNFLFL
jgi:hypothetical protein